MPYDKCAGYEGFECPVVKTGYHQRRSARCASCAQKGHTRGKGTTLSSEHREKISAAQLGKPNSLEARKNISLAQGGDGDILNRKYPGLQAWTRRNKAKTPFCEWCYSEDRLEAHHILPKAKFPQYATDDNNCRVMCQPCHSTCHKQGGF